MKVVLSAQGTHGDVRPMVSLGQAMAAAGHDVVCAASVPHRSLIEAQKLGFSEVGFDLGASSGDSDQAMGNPLRAVQRAFALMRELAVAQFEALASVAKNADVIAGAGLELSGRSVAEALEIPYVAVCYVPLALRSSYHPPVTIPYRPFPKWLNRLCWWSGELGMRWTFGREINRQRKKLGLQPVRDFGAFFSQDALLAADDVLAPWPPDWERQPRVPFLELKDGRPLGDELRQFIETGPAPVYLGFGSMPDPKPAHTLATIEQVSARLRLVVCNPRARKLCVRELPNVCWIDEAPHAQLFPLTAAVIHHGGAGTTHAAARAGVPQIIVPHIADQYYWAYRVRTLGLGPGALPRGALNSEALLRAWDLIKPGTEIARKAAEIGRQLTGTGDHGPERAARWIEQSCEQRLPIAGVPHP